FAPPNQGNVEAAPPLISQASFNFILTSMADRVINTETSTTSKRTILPSHIAETVDAVAQIHSDHHLKRSPVEIFMDDWTARLATPTVLAAIVCVFALWIAVNLLAPLAGYAVIDEPPFPWLFEALTLLGVVMGILIL